MGSNSSAPSEYIGDRVDGLANGKGTLTSEVGMTYDGEWVLGERYGVGRQTWPSGANYKGCWKENKPHGKGVYVYSNGCMYDGNFVNGERDGLGWMKWVISAQLHCQADMFSQYEGEWKDDEMHGYGTMMFRSGATHKGWWDYGVRSGPGMHTLLNGDYIQGVWVNDLVEGACTYYFASTKTMCVGFWRAGQPIHVKWITHPAL